MADDFGLVPPVGTKELSGVGRLSGVLPVVGPFPCDLIFYIRLQLNIVDAYPERDEFLQLRRRSDFPPHSLYPSILA
jgi:hypothetical protein